MADFAWANLAFGSRKPVNSLSAIFIAAPRQISTKRLKQIIKEYLPQGNIVIGLAEEPFVSGFENQPQFETLQLKDIESVIDQVQQAKLKHSIYTLSYPQSETPHVFEKLTFKKVLFVNGSWQHTFHTQPLYYQLLNAKTDFLLISAFSDEAEARQASTQLTTQVAASTPLPTLGSTLSVAEMMGVSGTAATRSFDNSFQTGVALGRKTSSGNYELLLATHNKVVPFETYAYWQGNTREQHFSVTHDANHYDTVHAEIELLLTAIKHNIDITDSSLFINLLPCPACSRMFADSPVTEFFYKLDHSDGYALRMLTAAGKTITRLV